FLLKTLALFFAVLLATVLLLTVPFGVNDIISNVVQLRIQAATDSSADPSVFMGYFKVQTQLIEVLVAGLCLSVIAFLTHKMARLPIILLFLWMLSTFAALLAYHPLFDHHLALLPVPVSVYFAFALSAVITHPAIKNVILVRGVTLLVVAAVIL